MEIRTRGQAILKTGTLNKRFFNARAMIPWNL